MSNLAKASPQSKKILWLCLGAGLILIALHIYLGLDSIGASSPTYDEPVHATAGYVYLKTGDYRYNGQHHPALAEMWAALPWLFLKPILPQQHPAWINHTWSPPEQYQFADIVLYRNRVEPEKLMNSARVMQSVMSSLFLLALFFIGMHRFVPVTGLWMVGLAALSPTLLAHSTIVSTDLSFAVFYFLFFICLSSPSKRLGRWGTGLCLGLCLASKYLALGLVPAVGVVALWKWRFEKKEALKEFLARLVWALLVALAVLCVVYRGSELSVFWEGLGRIFSRSQAGRSSFFMGQHSTKGWLGYFPFLLATKTEVALLVSLGIFFVLAFRKKVHVPPELFLPPVVFFILACVSKVQIGHRHLLAIYPFLYLWAGLGLGHFRGKTILVPIILMGGLLGEAWLARPFFLSYFNFLVGGSDRAFTYVTDSNVDWGQGLKVLAAELSSEDLQKGIFLSYFGTADPHAYQIKYADAGSDTLTRHTDDSTDPTLSPDKLAISVTNYQATYYQQKDIFSWLKDKTPQKLIGHSILLYDFKDDPEALSRLMQISPLGWNREFNRKNPKIQ